MSSAGVAPHGGGLRALVAGALDLAVPVHCAGCARPGQALCAGCAGSGTPLTRDVVGVGPVRAAGEYDGPLRAALVRYKERGRRELVRPLGAVLAGAVLSHPVLTAPRVLLVPIPSTPAAARRRGGDHLRRMASVVAGRTGLPARQVLRPVGAPPDSVGLTAVQRRAAVRGSLAARRAPPHCPPVLLLDDIVTTGATLAEASAVLIRAGFEVAGAAVLLSVSAPRPDAHRRRS